MKLKHVGWALIGILLSVVMALSGGALAAETKPTGGAAQADVPAVATGGAPGRYTVQMVIDGRVVGTFSEVSGLATEVEVAEVVEYKDGSDPIVHKRAGKAKYKNIVLKRGAVSGDTYMNEWFKKVLSGQTDRKSGSIIYLDREGKEVLRYSFFEAWPCRWKAPELNANSDTHLVEEIEFVVEKVSRN